MIKKILFISVLLISVGINIVLIRKMFVGNTQKLPNDTRVSIIVSQSNRDFVMHEMRTFVEALHQINLGIEQNNPALIAKVAHASGGSVADHAPAGLIASLPIEFKTLGFDTHAKFDEIAESVEKNFDPKQTHSQVTELLGNCVACHKMFRMDVK